MEGYSVHDFGGFSKLEGLASEDFFDVVVKKLFPHWECIDPKKINSKYVEYDRKVKDYSGSVTFDIKGNKRINRSDSEFTDEVWIERWGCSDKGRVYPGWIYHEDVDLLAFRLVVPGFVIVERKVLLDLTMKLIDWDTVMENASDALYKGYRRASKNYKDLIGRIKMTDLYTIPHFIWVIE